MLKACYKFAKQQHRMCVNYYAMW